MSQVNITLNTNTVDVNTTNNQIVVTNPDNPTTVNVVQPVTTVVEVITAGPQGPPGPIGSGSGGGSLTGGTNGYIPLWSGSTALTSSIARQVSGALQISGSVNITGSLAQGLSTTASGDYSHAEGYQTTASGYSSHAEGLGTQAVGNHSHAEGESTIVTGTLAHAEGRYTSASGYTSHAEGINTIASGDYSHAEGNTTVASGLASHAEGQQTQAIGESSHAEGGLTRTGTQYAFYSVSTVDGVVTVDSSYGNITAIVGVGNMLLFDDTTFENRYGKTAFKIASSIWDGTNTIITLIDTSVNTGEAFIGDLSHISSWATYEGDRNVFGNYSHVEGNNTYTLGQSSHAEGSLTVALGNNSHAEGDGTKTIGPGSHAEGNITKAIGDYSHAEGDNTEAKGDYSHAEGQETISSGSYSHAEGYNTQAIGQHSHAEGSNTQAVGDYSHAEGSNTISSGSYSHASGLWNLPLTSSGAFTVGNGTDANHRNNIFEVYNNQANVNGNLTVSGLIQCYSDITANNGFFGNLTGTASYATSASYALSSSRAVSSSYAVTSSYVQNAQSASYVLQAVSSSFATSASNSLTASYINPLKQTVQITGSLNVTGSETISGYLQLIPTLTNINNSISASYIYVSGSTNDLYFTQNGNGYANSTRLRWMEGNLYTGLLSGGVISSTLGSTTFNVSSGSGIIVSLNAFTASSDPFPTVQYVNWPTYTGLPITNSGSAKITYLSINSAGTVAQQTVPIGSTDVTQWDTQIELGVVLHLSGSVSTGVYNSPQVGYGFAQRTDDFVRAFGPMKLSGHTLQASGSSPTLSLIKGSGTAYNNGANYVNNPNHPSTVSDPAVNTSKIYRYYISGSTPVIDTGVANAGYDAIDSKYYVDTTTGTLALVGGAYWSIQRVFWIPNSPTNAFIVYYGNDRYRSLVDATNTKDSEPFIEAPNTAQNAIFLGYIIIQGGGSGTPPRDLLNASEATILQGGLFRNVGGIGSSGTSPIATTFASLSDVSVASRTNGDLPIYNGSQWANGKVLTGNYSINGDLTVTGSIIGTASLATTASYALTASYVQNAQSASYILNAVSASFAVSASRAVTASYAMNAGAGGTSIGLVQAISLGLQNIF